VMILNVLSNRVKWHLRSHLVKLWKIELLKL
jgi:hypothetical protein